MKDIKGISPSIVQHRIHLTDEVTPRRDLQRKLNPLMQEAVKAEILKLLDNEIIYPISDSQWVSPVHAVLKKAGFTVVENEHKSWYKQDCLPRFMFVSTIECSHP